MQFRTAASILLLLALVGGSFADVYMHNPRGSNDRNCERNENRNNGNRLFDSQNNDKGGYACPRAVAGNNPADQTPRMYYYAGSELTVEWTNQHACGPNEKTECHVVIQYMCENENPGLRDGIPENQNDAATDRMNEGDINNQRFGYHETLEYYQKCDTRTRNKGLWIADQDVPENGDATRTRQNPNGNRRGWECPEERDYMPYWHPTPWTDVAVLTSKPEMCEFYQTESENVKPRGECLDGNGGPAAANNEVDCTAEGNQWVIAPAKGVPAPECREMEWTRDNHLGSALSGQMAQFNWTIPADMQCDAAVLRLRYNITNGEVDWNLNSAYNKANSPLKQDPYTNAGLGPQYPLSLAVNTNQYSRTFQDRSYVFSVKPAPAEAAGKKIYNLNVRGKRGNIVQTYPAVEYDFTPAILDVAAGDYIHFQVSGSDYNPDRRPNNGEGGPVDPADGDSRRADRSNFMQMADNKLSSPASRTSVSMFDDDATITKMAYVGQDMSECLSNDELLQKNNGNQDDADADSQNCMKLNAAKTPYFDGGIVKMNNVGVFQYYSSRNNNFSNRGQKGVIRVGQGSSSGVSVGSLSGGAAVAVIAVIGVVVAGVGVGGAFMYAKRNPGSGLASAFSKVPLVGGRV